VARITNASDDDKPLHSQKHVLNALKMSGCSWLACSLRQILGA